MYLYIYVLDIYIFPYWSTLNLVNGNVLYNVGTYIRTVYTVQQKYCTTTPEEKVVFFSDFNLYKNLHASTYSPTRYININQK